MLAKLIVAAVVFFGLRWIAGTSFMVSAAVAAAVAWFLGDRIAGWFAPATSDAVAAA